MNLETLFLDIYGCGIKVIGNSNLLNYFKLYFNNFITDDDISITIEIIPTDVNYPLPIRVKGGLAGIDIEKNNMKSSYIIYYNNFVSGIDYELIVNYTRFLLFWPDKCQVHAGGVVKDGKSYIFFAPQNTGKTTLVLYLLKKGFSLLSDDWIILGEDKKAYSYPQPVNIYDYNLAYSIDWCREFYGKKAIFVQFIMKLRHKFKEKIVPLIPNRVLRFGVDWFLSMPIKRIPVSGDYSKNSGFIKKAFWLYRDRNFNKINIQRIDREALIERACATYMYEFSEYFKWYYLIAQRGKRIEIIENMQNHLRTALQLILKDVECVEVLIPHNTAPEELGDAILTKIQE
ncbi:MAG: hypothetical protein QXH95_04240 [Thermoplasmata archaeon]